MKVTNNIFDKWVFWFVMLLAVLPFGEIVSVRTPGIILNAFDFILISLLCILLLKIILSRKILNPLLIFIFISVALEYVFLSAAFYDVSIHAAVSQFRPFLPFLVALLLLSSGTSISSETWMKGLIITAGLSSLASLYIHYFAPGVIESAFSETEHIQNLVLERGRMYWSNASLAFFVLLGLFCKEYKIEKWVLLVVLILSFAALFSTFNRTVLAGYCLLFISTIFLSENTRMLFGRLTLVLVVLFSGILLVIILSFIDERISTLIASRFFGDGDIIEVYNTAVVKGRLGNYEQYMQSIAQYFPLGQGLGRPFASFYGTDVYITDISILSFLLPFGILGLLIFGLFLYRVFTIIGQSGEQISKQTKRILFLFVGLFIAMSFNIDFFSRNNFVIYLAILIISLHVPLENIARAKPVMRNTCQLH